MFCRSRPAGLRAGHNRVPPDWQGPPERQGPPVQPRTEGASCALPEQPLACGRQSERGVAAVEFALVLPLLLGVLLAVIELGLMLYNQAVITQASREGARYGIALTDPKRSAADISDEVIRRKIGPLLSLGGSTQPGVSVLQSGPAAYPNSLTVTVRYPFTGLAIAPLLGALGQPVVLSATTTMVHE